MNAVERTRAAAEPLRLAWLLRGQAQALDVLAADASDELAPRYERLARGARALAAWLEAQRPARASLVSKAQTRIARLAGVIGRGGVLAA